MTPEHEARIREIFALHTSGQYREFWDAFQGLSGTEIFTELQEVRDAFKLSSYLDTLAYIADYTLSEKDVVHYRHHKKRYSRIGNMPGVATQLRRLLERGTQEAHKMNTIRSILSETPLKVPSMSGAPDTIREEWFGFDEDDAQSRTLFEVVVALVKTRPAYKKKDEDSTKKLLRVVKLLL
ncbi:hypothetical protein H6768_00325 [Candidatus Peribacteria bacterium]|nr:hypothetical protein [Candidatus Peribacteria bacterium]